MINLLLFGQNLSFNLKRAHFELGEIFHLLDLVGRLSESFLLRSGLVDLLQARHAPSGKNMCHII